MQDLRVWLEWAAADDAPLPRGIFTDAIEALKAVLGRVAHPHAQLWLKCRAIFNPIVGVMDVFFGAPTEWLKFDTSNGQA